MFHRWAAAINLLTGLLLAGCLGLVFAYDRQTHPVKPPEAPQGGSQELEVRFVQENSPAQKQPQKRLRLAVISPVGQIWDDMGKLLGGLGEGYQFSSIDEKNLKADPSLLDRARFDVVFLTCQGGGPPGNEYKDQLSRFVNEGGVLYASDCRFGDLASAFPGFVDRGLQGLGSRQVVPADVQDHELREALGKTIELSFDQDGWVTAAFAGEGVTTLVHGNYRKYPSNEMAWAPLLVKFQVGKGTVVFTSFHNEKINSQTAKKLLQHLVFRLVTTDTDVQVKTSIQEGGFSTKRSNLLGMVREDPSITKTYRNEKAGPLRFALGFRNEGARLELTIHSPDGKSFRWEGTATVVLEVPQAVVGEWSYTVKALSFPYDNFPFTVRVAERN